MMWLCTDDYKRPWSRNEPSAIVILRADRQLFADSATFGSLCSYNFVPGTNWLHNATQVWIVSKIELELLLKLPLFAWETISQVCLSTPFSEMANFQPCCWLIFSCTAMSNTHHRCRAAYLLVLKSALLNNEIHSLLIPSLPARPISW